MMSDKKLNEYIDYLLGWSKQERMDSNGSWASSFDGAMSMWVDRHPGTRPPAYAKSGRRRRALVETFPPFMTVSLSEDR